MSALRDKLTSRPAGKNLYAEVNQFTDGQAARPQYELSTLHLSIWSFEKLDCRKMIATVRACALGLILALAAPSLAGAADETIVMRLGVTSILNLDNAFETVMIADPEIVDIHTLDNRSVILEPLKIGAANLIFVNASSVVTANIRVLVRGASLTDDQRSTGEAVRFAQSSWFAGERLPQR
jgi:Flp pilus assembly secretin CpaC